MLGCQRGLFPFLQDLRVVWPTASDDRPRGRGSDSQWRSEEQRKATHHKWGTKDITRDNFVPLKVITSKKYFIFISSHSLCFFFICAIISLRGTHFPSEKSENRGILRKQMPISKIFIFIYNKKPLLKLISVENSCICKKMKRQIIYICFLFVWNICIF